ncbi:hypothetical protein GUITHDRAFT_68809, partial [Guillardia theta CCMP2712]
EQNRLQEVLREVEVMRCLNHPNCIKLYATYENDQQFFIVMEYADGGQLLDRIAASEHYWYQDCLSQNDQVKLARQVSYLHTKNVVHRDLKPENILFSDLASARLSPNATIKLCDFGLSRRALLPRQRFCRCGSPDYIAPEVLERCGYGFECDVWSLGVILFLVLPANSSASVQ